MAVYVLIGVGATVRSTGAGMGCPDWPTCFGQWVPPTSVTQLPENYKEIYLAYRDKKNQRFAGFLESIGMKTTANQLRHDESIRREADFNAVKTWIEYINRLVGMLAGLLVTGVFVLTLLYRASKPIVWLAAGALLLIAVTGWFGSIVVSTNLTPWTVTLHMLLALALVALLVLIKVRLKQPAIIKVKLPAWMGLACVLTVGQVVLGTQVREAIDVLTQTGAGRESWIGQLGVPFIIHRSFSWLVLAVNAFIIWKIYRESAGSKELLWLGVLTLLPVLTGAGMAWFNVPAFLQPLHLVAAALLFGVQWNLWLQMQSADEKITIQSA